MPADTPLPMLGGLSAADFLGQYWQRKPLLIRGAFPDIESPLSPDELAGLACEEGIEAVGVWPAFQWSPQGLMVHTASGIERFEDIEGGTIAIEVGSAFQRFLWSSFSWKDKVQAVPYGGEIGPFLQDPSLVQQAYITAEPCLAQAQGAEVGFLKASDAGWNPYGSLLALPEPLPAAARGSGWGAPPSQGAALAPSRPAPRRPR